MKLNYRITFLFVLSLISLKTYADVSFAKAQNFLKKNNNCYFAVGLSNPNGPKLANPDVTEDIFCVTDGSIGSETINQKNGCSLMLLNMTTGKFRKGTFNAMMNPKTVDLAIVEGVICQNGGFEKLLEKKFNSVYGEGPKVKEILFNGPQGIESRTSILYSANESAQKSYDQAVEKLTQEAKVAEANAREIKREDQLKTEKLKLENSEKEKRSVSSIEGVWQKSCEKHSNQLYTVQTRKYFKNSYEIKYEFYSKDDTSCEKEISHVDVIKGRYKLEGLVDSKQKVYGIQFIPEKYYLIPKQKSLVTDLTEASHAGILAWSIDKEHDVSKANKVDGTKTFYSIFKVTTEQLILSTPVDDPKATRSMADSRVFKKIDGDL